MNSSAVLFTNAALGCRFPLIPFFLWDILWEVATLVEQFGLEATSLVWLFVHHFYYFCLMPLLSSLCSCSSEVTNTALVTKKPV